MTQPEEDRALKIAGLASLLLTLVFVAGVGALVFRAVWPS